MGPLFEKGDSTASDEKSNPTKEQETQRQTEATIFFERDGFVCLRNAIKNHSNHTSDNDKDNLKEWQEFAQRYFQTCFDNLHKNGHTKFPTHVINKTDHYNANESDNHGYEYAMGLGVKHGFREIVMRSPGRYELSLLHCQDQCPSIDWIKDCLFPVIPNLLGAGQWDEIQLCHLSLVISTRGSPEQSWHADGGHVSMTEHLPCHVANVFIPLQPVSAELGPTEFRPGTHVYTRNLAPMMLAAKARKQLQPPVLPELELGDALVFDYRVLHRGKANRSNDTDRVILVLTFAKKWYKDVCNFPTRSMFDTSASKRTNN